MADGGGGEPRARLGAQEFIQRARSLFRQSRAIWSLLLLISVVQGVYWFLIEPAFGGRTAELPPRIELSAMREGVVAVPNYADIDLAALQPVDSLPTWRCCEPGYRAFAYKFELPPPPHEALGLIIGANADNVSVYVNEDLVSGRGRMTLPDITYHGNLREVVRIPAGILQAGENEVVYILVRDAIPYFDYRNPLLAEYAPMAEASEFRAFILGPYQWIMVSACLVVAFFAFVVCIRSDRWRLPFWTGFLTLAWALNNHYYLWPDPPFSGQTRIAYFSATTLMVALGWLGWADSWSRRKLPWMLPVALALTLGACLAAALAFHLGEQGPGYDLADSITNWTGVLLAAATLIRLLWGMIGVRDERHLEIALVVLLVTLMALQLLNEQFWGINRGYLQRAQPLLIISLAAAFVARNVHLFQSREELNRQLSDRLEARTAELAAVHREKERLVRNQGQAEERARILRDMHDGLGSTLMSMLLAARRRAIQPEEFEEQLQSVVDEMRLILNSMESVGSSIPAMLQAFRERSEHRLHAAGFEFDWEQAGETGDLYGPGEALQLYRILQEAVTNALKHSGGQRVMVRVDRSGDELAISVSDNGTGDVTEAEGPGGRGLLNMQARASRLGAKLNVSAEPGRGTTVTIKMPAAKAPEDATGEYPHGATTEDRG